MSILSWCYVASTRLGANGLRLMIPYFTWKFYGFSKSMSYFWMSKAFEASARYPNPSVIRHVIEFQPLSGTCSGTFPRFFGSTTSKFRRLFLSGWMLRYMSVIWNKRSSMDLKSCSSDEVGSTGWPESSCFGGLVSSEDVIPEIKFIPYYYLANINKNVSEIQAQSVLT